MEDDLTRRKPARGKAPARKAATKKKAETSGSATEMSEIERRVHPRHSVSWPVRLWVDGAAVAGRTVDVSERGLCVLLSGRVAKLDIGAPYRLDIIMGPKHEVSVTAEVRYLADSVVGLQSRQRLKLV